jgi:hypothetical protein
MENMYRVDLEDENDSSFKSGSDSFEKDFDDIRSETQCELRYLKKIQVSEPSVSGREAVFTITTVFQQSKNSEEQLKKVNRKYSEYVWLHKQLQKSFPGCLIPSLPSMSDINRSFTIKTLKGQEASDTVAELAYNLNNHVTLSNYTAQILGNDRFKNFVKLKEFITNPEQIKNIPNMDSDDPILHSKIFKFIKSKGKSFMEYAWGKEAKANPHFIELQGKGEKNLSSNELSIGEIEALLRSVKKVITQQVNNLNELCTNIETFIRQIAEEKACFGKMSESFETVKEYDPKVEMQLLYTKMGETTGNLQKYQNELAVHIKTNVLVNARKILSKYLSIDSAIDRLLDLSVDVEDLKTMVQKYKEEPELQETYRAEYQHYLALLRNNFDFLKEDSARLQRKEDKNMKKVVQEFYKAQVMYFEGQDAAWKPVDLKDN